MCLRFEVCLATGSQENDVMGYDREQLIADILDQYERHLEYLRLQRETLPRARVPEQRDPTTPEPPPEG